MFTVLRFIAPGDAGDDAIYRLGAELNSCVADSFKRPDRVGGRFSVTVAANGQWTEHDAKLLAFLDVIQPAVRSATAAGFALECDALVEPEDLAGVTYLNITPSLPLLQRLVSERVTLNITVWGQSLTDDEGIGPGEGL